MFMKKIILYFAVLLSLLCGASISTANEIQKLESRKGFTDWES